MLKRHFKNELYFLKIKNVVVKVASGGVVVGAGLGVGVVLGVCVRVGVGVCVRVGVRVGVEVGVEVGVGVDVGVEGGVGVVDPIAEDPPDGRVGDAAHNRAHSASTRVDSGVVDVRSRHGHGCVW